MAEHRSIWARFSTRRCRRILCRDTEPHDAHLTIIGRFRYRGDLALLLRERAAVEEDAAHD